MVRSGCIGATVALLAAAVATTADAHHSFGMFDMQSSITIEGTVKEFQWTNPHVWIEVDVIDPATSKLIPWSIESDAVNMLRSKGWSRTSLKAGDKVKMVVHPLKSGKVGGALVTASVDGKQIGNDARAR